MTPQSPSLPSVLSGKPLHQGGGCAGNPDEDPDDRPGGQVSRLLHGNVTSRSQRTDIHPEGAGYEYELMLSAQWLSVLDIIAKALFDNSMEFAQINGIHKFQVRYKADAPDEVFPTWDCFTERAQIKGLKRRTNSLIVTNRSIRPGVSNSNKRWGRNVKLGRNCRPTFTEKIFLQIEQ